MKLLEERILSQGTVIGDDIVKVDCFINHMVDPILVCEMAKEIKRLYQNTGVTKIITVESSGIAIATLAALELGVPFVFAKKNSAKNLDDNTYKSDVYSFTKQKTYSIRIAKDYIGKEDRLLFVDDFLANGAALNGLIDIANQAGAAVVGSAIAIEKAFQSGGKKLRAQGYRIDSLARIKSISNGKIEFCD